MSQSKTTTHIILSAEDRKLLGSLISSMGEHAVLAGLGLSRQALARALAGLGIRNGTLALIRLGIHPADRHNSDARGEADS